MSAEDRDAKDRLCAAHKVPQLAANRRCDLDERQRELAGSAEGPLTRRFSHFEPAGLHRALRAWNKWRAWTAGRRLDAVAAAACPLTVDEFVFSHRSARTSAHSVWLALRWLN